MTLAPEQLGSKIASVIESELAALNMRKIALDTSKVDWNRVMHDAAFRKPPFQATPLKRLSGTPMWTATAQRRARRFRNAYSEADIRGLR